MCGIVGAVAQRDVAPILLLGLQRLEYRGYDSAGMACIDAGKLQLQRVLGKVAALQQLQHEYPLAGGTGIAHTRWATHGVPCERNAHPHRSGHLVVVHNGIIENYLPLKLQLQQQGYEFQSDTDSEVIAHLIHQQRELGLSLLEAVQHSCQLLTGAYGMAVIDEQQSGQLVVARKGSPLVIGVGIGEHFIASDALALLPVTRRFIYLEEGDIAQLSRESVQIYAQGQPVERPVVENVLQQDAADKGAYRHYMRKEIDEQPQVVRQTLTGRLSDNGVSASLFNPQQQQLLAQVQHVQLLACGTSYHAALVARYWLEQYAQVSCSVEIASEYRYRQVVVPANSLLVTLSQSGETADTLAALRLAKQQGYLATLTICNTPGSSLVRESDWVLMTCAGQEIGVASTKAFTSQLTALWLLVATLAQRLPTSAELAARLQQALLTLPELMQQVLTLSDQIESWAAQFLHKQHALFLGRGELYPIALEGALKLKEISYIHAEAYAAGELKHGPLALIDEEMPVVVVAANNQLVAKLAANLEEVKARGGQLYLFIDQAIDWPAQDNVQLIRLPSCDELLSPILYTLPLQLLAYHVAVIKGTDVDQPRNLAKSVTVE